jgi:hypothetical protein
MKLVSGICEKCGAKIPDDTTREVCPACLLETGLGFLADEAVADPLAKDFRTGDLSGVALAKADDGVRVTDRKKAKRPAATASPSRGG